jgi:polyisoprenoid-binding protein YceI
MKKITRIILATFAMLAIVNVNAVEPNNSDNKTIDVTKSTINWKGEKVTGEHNGTITIKSGKLEMSGNKLVGGEFVIDMSSIECTDLDGEYKTKLENHLKSDDFFGVSKYPESKLKITSVSGSKKEGTYTVSADLTIKGIKKNVDFMVNLISDNGVLVANTNIIVDRSIYNIRYGSGTFFDNLGDKTIYDEFVLTVNLVTK